MREKRWQSWLGGGFVLSVLTYALTDGAVRAGYFFDEAYGRVAIGLCLAASLAIVWEAIAVLQMRQRGAWLRSGAAAIRRQAEGVVLWPLLIALAYLSQPLWLGELPL
ncbi:hypothetical protein, partial [Paenibacillus sp. 598K]|uniref:hypothetical protein n=1 Tax=Paenibacillus sp. 598K TaxID=1117987 RepID=UPI00162650DE